MPQNTTKTEATKQFAGNPYRITQRRNKFVLESPEFLEANEKLNALIEKYDCKYCNVTADSKGRVNIKFKILKRIYFFSKEENFLKSVNKLQDIIEKYIQCRRANLLKSYLLSED